MDIQQPKRGRGRPPGSKNKIQTASEPGFIVMNEYGEFYAGFMYGRIVFTFGIENAKPLYDLHKFETLKLHVKNPNLIFDYTE